MTDLFTRLEPQAPQPDDRRPVLLAMNNPLSSNPAHALYPHPQGCAGWNLWRMLATSALLPEPPTVVTKADYLSAFDRRNLLSARVWSAADARRAAGGLLDALRGRRVAVLGAGTLKALRLPRKEWGVWTEIASGPTRDLTITRYCLLPHPSGRCREYNDPAMRAMTGRVLLDMYREYRPAHPEGIGSA